MNGHFATLGPPVYARDRKPAQEQPWKAYRGMFERLGLSVMVTALCAHNPPETVYGVSGVNPVATVGRGQVNPGSSSMRACW